MLEPKWHIVSADALPATMGSLDETPDIDLLEKSGFDTAAKTAAANAKAARAAAEEKRRREAQIPADELYVRLSESDQKLLGAHFQLRTTPAAYNGEPPSEIVQKFLELQRDKTLESIELWCAPDGETLAIGTAHNEDEKRTYLIVQWGAESEYTTLEMLAKHNAVAARKNHGKYVRACILAVACYSTTLFCCGYSFYSLMTGRQTSHIMLMGMYLLLFVCPWAIKRMKKAGTR